MAVDVPALRVDGTRNRNPMNSSSRNQREPTQMQNRMKFSNYNSSVSERMQLSGRKHHRDRPKSEAPIVDNCLANAIHRKVSHRWATGRDSSSK